MRNNDVSTRRIIYEKGITCVAVDSDWHIANLGGGQTERIESPAIIAQRYGVRPVVVTESYGNDLVLDRLLKRTGPVCFGLAITDVSQKLPQSFPTFYKGLNLSYLLSAVQYHCTRLACHYSIICGRYSRLPFDESHTHEQALFQGESEPYFEFDALVTAVRRAYDSCRYLLWQYFGPGRGHTPSSFYKTLPLCSSSMSKELAERLASSWSTHGELVTAYRDCIQHYVPVDFPNSSVHMQKLDNGTWTAQMIIPDNPSAKVRTQFTYDKMRDALSYGWEVATEVVEIAEAISEAIAVRKGDNAEVHDAQPERQPDA